MNFDFSKDQVLEVDIHKMDVWQAMNYLERLVTWTPSNIKEIVVIHGYHSGTTLLKMVRHEFKHKRIQRKFLSLNQGRTSLILN